MQNANNISENDDSSLTVMLQKRWPLQVRKHLALTLREGILSKDACVDCNSLEDWDMHYTTQDALRELSALLVPESEGM